MCVVGLTQCYCVRIARLGWGDCTTTCCTVGVWARGRCYNSRLAPCGEDGGGGGVVAIGVALLWIGGALSFNSVWWWWWWWRCTHRPPASTHHDTPLLRCVVYFVCADPPHPPNMRSLSVGYVLAFIPAQPPFSSGFFLAVGCGWGKRKKGSGLPSSVSLPPVYGAPAAIPHSILVHCCVYMWVLLCTAVCGWVGALVDNVLV